MSRKSRNEAAANEMYKAGCDAAIIIEACENKHKLTHGEALDVLCACVCQFLARDGENDPKLMKSRLQAFGDHLADYASDVFGVVWVPENDSNETEKSN